MQFSDKSLKTVSAGVSFLHS